MQNNLNEFIELVAKSIADQTFVKMSLGNYNGNELNLKNIYIKLIRIKETEKLSFTYRYKTKDIVKNYSQSEALLFFAENITVDSFQIANLFTLKSDFQLIIGKKNKQGLKTAKPSQSTTDTQN